MGVGGRPGGIGCDGSGASPVYPVDLTGQTLVEPPGSSSFSVPVARSVGARSITVEPDGGPGPPFLVFTAANARTVDRRPPCAVGRRVCTGCGDVVWLRCRKPSCLHCGPGEAASLARAIAYTGAGHTYTLTLVGESWQERRHRVFRWRYRMRERYRTWSDCWTVEANPRGTGHHAHGCDQFDAPVDFEFMRWAARREGLGSRVERQVVKTVGEATRYPLKEALWAAYGLKGAAGAERLGIFLEANGGRLVHASRGFWRHPDGVVIGGPHPMRTAMTAAREFELGAAAACVGGRAHRWSPIGGPR